MKKLFTLLLVVGLVLLNVNANPNSSETEMSKSEFSNSYLSYNVTKEGSSVVVSLEINELSQYTIVEVLRSNSPSENFRRIKFLQGETLNDLNNNSEVVDKYPLSSKSESYYKISTTDRDGVVRFYPSVKLMK